MARTPQWTRSQLRNLLGNDAGDAALDDVRSLRRRRGPPPVKAIETVPTASRVLGLDLALRTGWAVVADGRLLMLGSFSLPAAPHVNERRPAFLLRRRHVLAKEVEPIVREYRPDVVAYEYTDMARPAWSHGSKGREQVVASAHGILEGFLLPILDELSVQIMAIPSRSARQVVTGRVDAPKEYVRLTLQARLGLDLSSLTEDEVDAAMIALSVVGSSPRT
jgi:Holliday junction resolvasome RuvABC endonuclease subunit